MKPREEGERTADALKKKRYLSEKVILHVEEGRQVEEWAQKNVDARPPQC
jgi:hypothetical protein